MIGPLDDLRYLDAAVQELARSIEFQDGRVIAVDAGILPAAVKRVNIPVRSQLDSRNGTKHQVRGYLRPVVDNAIWRLNSSLGLRQCDVGERPNHH